MTHPKTMAPKPSVTRMAPAMERPLHTSDEVVDEGKKKPKQTRNIPKAKDRERKSRLSSLCYAG